MFEVSKEEYARFVEAEARLNLMRELFVAYGFLSDGELKVFLKIKEGGGNDGVSTV